MSKPKKAIRKPEPVRKRISIPFDDKSTLAWWAVQENPAYSLRLLIHDYIEREGYTDPHNKPVQQLPKRGRPPQVEDDIHEVEQLAQTIAETNTVETQPQQQPTPAKTLPVTRPQSVASQSSRQVASQQKPHLQPELDHDPGSTPGVEGVGAFFAANRD